MRYAISIIVALLTTGCVTSEYMPMGREYPPRPDDSPVAVYIPATAPLYLFSSADHPRAIYADSHTTDEQIRQQLPGMVAIGRVDVSGAPAAPWSFMFVDAAKKARRLGGDAVVVWDFDTDFIGYSEGTALYEKVLRVVVMRKDGSGS